MPRYLLDASALYPILEKPSHYISVLEDSVILDLTLYEIGNAALVAQRRGLLGNYRSFLKSFSKAASMLPIERISPEDIEGIGRVAEETGLTYYDAAYVYMAERLGLTLVTEDREILEKAPHVARRLRDLVG